MNVVDGKKLTQEAINPTINRLNNETIPQTISGITTAADGIVQLILGKLQVELLPKLKAVIVEGLGEGLAPTMQHVEDLVDRIDGTTINLGGKQAIATHARIVELEATVRVLQEQLSQKQ